MGNGLYDFWKRATFVKTHPLDAEGIALMIRAIEPKLLQVRLPVLWHTCWNPKVVILQVVLAPTISICLSNAELISDARLGMERPWWALLLQRLDRRRGEAGAPLSRYPLLSDHSYSWPWSASRRRCLDSAVHNPIIPSFLGS